ncbi:flippase [Bacillus sp. AFS026049]|uniref:flippase n=1 Tax=Peribacillus frigoritolerans TaxID=450367 RepID=UPI000BF70CC3|nr:flippase [Bacillus sp. AFS026049]
MGSLKKNTIYSFLNQIVLVMIPFITFPYISRVLGPENYGVINYATSIVTIFSVFAGAGLVGHASREIVKNRNDKQNLGKVFQELFLIQLFLTIFIMIVYCLFIVLNTGMQIHIIIYFITGLTMMTNLFTFQWFFIGVEDFKYITTRDAVVKTIFVVLVFTLVRDENDYLVYVCLNLISFILTALLNSYYLLKHIKLKKEKLNLKRHSKPIYIALTISFISSLTIQLNSILLGSIASKENLGYFNVGVKITSMLVIIISNVFYVILPRFTQLNGTNEFSSQQKLMDKIIHFLGMISIPAFIGLFVYSKLFILLLFGKDYTNSILVSQVTSIGLVIMPLVALFANFMYSSNKESNSIYIMIISLSVNIISNILLTPKYLFLGAAVAFILTELTKLIIYLIYLYKIKIIPSFFSLHYILYFFLSLLTIALPNIVIQPTNVLKTVCVMIFSVILYFLFLKLVKDRYFVMLLDTFTKKNIKG